MKRPLFAIALLALASCASVPDHHAKTDCHPPAGWRELAAKAEGRILVFGDHHGISEDAPAVAEYVCAATAEYGGRTVMAMEMSASDAVSLKAALASDDPALAMKTLMPDFWRLDDGRASEALFKFLVRMAALQREGLQIDVKPFVEFSPETRAAPSQEGVERDYANGVMTAAKGADRTIVMVGDLHASKKTGAYDWMTYQPMASLLPESAISLDIVHDGGTAWIRESDKPGGVRHQLATMKRPSPSSYPRIVLDETMAPFYDGYLYVGPITASPPVLPPKKDGAP